MEKDTSHHMEVEIGRADEEENSLESLFPQQTIPRRRGSPKKKKEIGEDQASIDPCTNLATKELCMCAIQLEPVEGLGRETWDKRRRKNTKGLNIHEPS
jgi:hypothetical protein